MKNCKTCNRPANDRYANAAAGEVCVDRSHDPHITIAQRIYAETQREAIASRSAALARYGVGLGRGYCVYDRETKSFGPQLANKRAAIAEAKRLNAELERSADLTRG